MTTIKVLIRTTSIAIHLWNTLCSVRAFQIDVYYMYVPYISKIITLLGLNITTSKIYIGQDLFENTKNF